MIFHFMRVVEKNKEILITYSPLFVYRYNGIIIAVHEVRKREIKK